MCTDAQGVPSLASVVGVAGILSGGFNTGHGRSGRFCDATVRSRSATGWNQGTVAVRTVVFPSLRSDQ